MIYINEKKDCCGCTACVSSCPRDCITMVCDEEGFMYPKVQTDDCIDCGMCEKVCPVLSKKSHSKNTTICETYVGYIKDEEIRASSSSGGIFSVIAQYVIENEGIVFGAAFDSNFVVKHIRVETKKELFRLRGSKYAQSDVSGIYAEVLSELKNNRLVLFTGTSCQISGLKGYLQHDYSNLITVDILCHGVPSPIVWKKYLDEMIKENGEIKSVNLRSKTCGWYNYSTRIEFTSGTVLEHSHFEDAFMQLFLGDICLRPSCHYCRFKDINRDADITIGDSWGIDRIDPQFQDDRGTSVVILHSQKGKGIFTDIKEFIFCSLYDLEKVLPSNSKSRLSVEAHVNRSRFFKHFREECTFTDLLKMLKISFIDKIKKKIKSELIKWKRIFLLKI